MSAFRERPCRSRTFSAARPAPGAPGRVFFGTVMFSGPVVPGSERYHERNAYPSSRTPGHHHGRQRPLGPGPRSAARGGAPCRCRDRAHHRDRMPPSGHPPPDPVHLFQRELVAAQDRSLGPVLPAAGIFGPGSAPHGARGHPPEHPGRHGGPAPGRPHGPAPRPAPHGGQYGHGAQPGPQLRRPPSWCAPCAA